MKTANAFTLRRPSYFLPIPYLAGVGAGVGVAEAAAVGGGAGASGACSAGAGAASAGAAAVFFTGSGFLASRMALCSERRSAASLAWSINRFCATAGTAETLINSNATHVWDFMALLIFDTPGI